ncbi:hypothetical protein [Cupriavidus taiwanensis]|uniref:Uncharacterized protein n=1 Tax=Cupriavidus taiwanensis TaxID=164546 RepID=A0A375JEG5_9BURK|nr:hypothetical protein [Cupriavidus taiwanensis]SPS02971.1 hypothetical protein CBM2634_U510006 [Cupriavidus taiwanensis]
MAEVEEDNAALQEEVGKLKGELLQREAALAAVRTECDKAIAAAAEQVAEARTEAEKERTSALATRDALAVANARLEEMPALRAERDATRRMAEALEQQVAEQKTALSKAEAELAGLREALNAERSAAASAAQAAAVAGAERDAANRSAEEARERLATLEGNAKPESSTRPSPRK